MAGEAEDGATAAGGAEESSSNTAEVKSGEEQQHSSGSGSGTRVGCRIVMGVNSLSPLAKGVGSVQVSLRHGQGSHVIIDGRFLNRRMSVRGTSARDLVIEDDLTAHVRQCARHVRAFEDLGYRVTVVFDGAVPPAKASTAADRARQRELAGRRARELDSRGVQPDAVNQVASKACAFDSRTVARIAALLRPKIKGKVFMAPGEIGAQLVVFQDIYRRNPEAKIVYVYADDSDLIVLGARSLLWEVSEAEGGGGALSGSCIHARMIFQPSPREFAVDSDAHAFLRQLHGLPRRHDAALRARPLSEDTARARLTLYAAVVGNDYAAFENVDPVAAAKIALKPVQGSARAAPVPPFGALVPAIARSLAELSREGSTPRNLRRVEEKLRTCNNMFRHAVVWDPVAGVLRHFSGVATSGEITKDTGTLALSSMASRIAAGELCASTGRAWVPPLTEMLRGRQRAGTDARQGNSQKRGQPGLPPPSPLPSQAKIPKRTPQDASKSGGLQVGGQGKSQTRGPLGHASPLKRASPGRIPKRVPPDTSKHAFSSGGQGSSQKRGMPVLSPPAPLPSPAKIPRRVPHDIDKHSNAGAERVSQKRGLSGPLVLARPLDRRKNSQPETPVSDSQPKNGINSLPYEGEDINAWIASRDAPFAGSPGVERRRSLTPDGSGTGDREVASPASPWSSLGKAQRSANSDGKDGFVVWGRGGGQKREPSGSPAPARSPDPRKKSQPESYVADRYPRNGANRPPHGGGDITKWISSSRGAPIIAAVPVVQPPRCLASGCGKVVDKDVSFCSDDCMVAAQKQAARALAAIHYKQKGAASSSRGALPGVDADDDAKHKGFSVPRKGKKSRGEPEGRAPQAADTAPAAADKPPTADIRAAASVAADTDVSAERSKASAAPSPLADEEGFEKGLEAVRGARSEQGRKFRHKVVEIFRELFAVGMAELGVDPGYAAAHCGVLAWDLEHELNAFFHANREGYREKAQSLRFNIKFAKNPELFKDLLAGITSMRTLCGMSIDDLASSHLKEERKRIRDGSYAGHLRQEVDGSEIVYVDGALQRIANIKSDAEKQVDALPGVDFDIENGGRRDDDGKNISGGGATSRSSSSSSSISSR